MTDANKIFFYIDDIDKNKLIGLSVFLRNKPDIINKCFKFSINPEKSKYGVNISLNSLIVDVETFDTITKSIILHFNNDNNIFYKTGNETDKKYTFSNLTPKRNIRECEPTPSFRPHLLSRHFQFPLQVIKL
jgi:hypothetical protein